MYKPISLCTTFWLENPRGKKLSGFYPNALGSGRLVFRKSDYYTFPTIEEACKFLQNIYNLGIGLNLDIRCS